MKTPEEIKKGLSEPELFCSHCQNSGEPHGCNRPNGSCQAFDNADDALTYIQRLEARNAELVRKTEQLQLERDALIDDLYSVVNDYVTPCFCCKNFDPSTTVCDREGVDCFIWRGLLEKPEEK